MGYSFAVIRGLNTSYIKVGKGPALVFIPGLLSTAIEYEKFFSLLQKHFTVYAINLPGFGPSQEAEEPYSVDKYGDFVLKFMKAMKIRKVVIMAHSAGGFVALNVALRFPGKVVKLVLLDSAGLKMEYKPRGLMYRLLITKTWKELKDANERKAFLRLLPRAIFDFIAHPFRGNLWKTVERNINLDYSGRLNGLRVPTILIWGKEDELFSLDYAKRFHRLIKNSRLIIVDGDHDWPALCPRINWKKIKPKII